ncbi:hypothetical protein [Arthrobacter sp. UYCu712]|uniref:hypothetical protein n=1 Tax=Arthrobacter sp. UYCu712 TaxID=3156340 RepID=UPI003390CEB9
MTHADDPAAWGKSELEVPGSAFSALPGARGALSFCLVCRRAQDALHAFGHVFGYDALRYGQV